MEIEILNLLEQYNKYSNMILNESDDNNLMDYFDKRDDIIIELENRNFLNFKNNDDINNLINKIINNDEKIIEKINDDILSLQDEISQVIGEKIELFKNKFSFRSYVKNMINDDTNYYIDKKS